jgi:hypothetical protein
MSKTLMYVRRRIRGTARLVAIYKSLELARFGVIVLSLGTWASGSAAAHPSTACMCVWDKAEERYDVLRYSELRSARHEAWAESGLRPGGGPLAAVF